VCFLNRTHSEGVSSIEHITKTESEPAYECVSLRERQRQTKEEARESKGTLKDNRNHEMKTWRRGKTGPKRERKSQRRERNSPKRERVRRAREGREGGGGVGLEGGGGWGGREFSRVFVCVDIVKEQTSMGLNG